MITQPSLLRVDVYGMALALAANVLLWRVAVEDDGFANIIAVGSGVGAVALIVSYHKFPQWLGESFLLAFGVWIANTIEFAFRDAPRWETQVRLCGFYLAFALIALGSYLSQEREVMD